LTVGTPVFKAPSVSLSLYLCGSLRTYKWFVTLTVATPILKAPSVSLSHFIYMIRYIHLSGLLR